MITEKQRELRRNHLGSTDMAAVLGLDPWTSAYDVYLEKTGKLQEQKETKVMQRGSFLEPALLNFAESLLGKITRNQYRSAREKGVPLGSHADAIVDETGNPVEAKSKGFYAKEHWGEASTDDIPDRIIVQTFVHMICCDSKTCHVPAYLAMREFQMFMVDFNKDVADTICEVAIDFWDNHVQKDVPPGDSKPSLSVMRRIIRTPNKIVPINPDLWEAYKLNQKMESAFGKAKDGAHVAIMLALGDAEAGRIDEVGNLVTYFEQKRKAYKVDECTYRVLRLKKAKGT